MLKIIDTHQHLWDTENLEYPWLEGFDSVGENGIPRKTIARQLATLTSSNLSMLRGIPLKRRSSRRLSG